MYPTYTVVRGRSDTGELSLLACGEPGRERRANAVGRAVSDQGRDAKRRLWLATRMWS